VGHLWCFLYKFWTLLMSSNVVFHPWFSGCWSALLDPWPQTSRWTHVFKRPTGPLFPNLPVSFSAGLIGIDF